MNLFNPLIVQDCKLTTHSSVLTNRVGRSRARETLGGHHPWDLQLNWFCALAVFRIDASTLSQERSVSKSNSTNCATLEGSRTVTTDMGAASVLLEPGLGPLNICAKKLVVVTTRWYNLYFLILNRTSARAFLATQQVHRDTHPDFVVVGAHSRHVDTDCCSCLKLCGR
jgi:hypothetical protein